MATTTTNNAKYASQVAKYVLQETERLVKHQLDSTEYYEKIKDVTPFLDQYHSEKVDRIKIQIMILLHKVRTRK